MHSVANMVSSCRSCSSSSLSVDKISSEPSASQHHGAPRHPQADAECGLSRAAAADISDEGVHPAVRGLDHVVEIATEQVVLAAGQAARRYAEPGVGQQRRREQAALEPDVLLGVELRHLQLTLRFFGPLAFHRVPDDPV